MARTAAGWGVCYACSPAGGGRQVHLPCGVPGQPVVAGGLVRYAGLVVTRYDASRPARISQPANTCHQGLCQRVPHGYEGCMSGATLSGSVRAVPVLGGLHHAYESAA